MDTYSATTARNKLYSLIDKVASTHKPLLITGKRSNAVLISEEDWSTIQEALYSESTSKMIESIKAGLKTPLKNCYNKLDW